MYRQHLLQLLQRYRTLHPEEDGTIARIADFVASHKDCFLRTCRPGHITASAWVVSADHRHFLLTHHRKLNRWLQIGGHADGEPEPWRVALREVREESGLWVMDLPTRDGDLLPIDVDVHTIPAHGDDLQHLHYDIRFLMVATSDHPPRANHESHELRWFGWRDLDRIGREESIRRMAGKALDRLEAHAP